VIHINIFRSVANDTHEHIELEEPKTIQEVFPAIDFTDSILSVNGFRQDATYLLQDGDVCTIRLFPQGNAGDWVAGFVIGAVTGFLLGGIPGLFIGMAIGTISFGSLSASGYSFLEAANGLFAPKPDIKSPDTLARIPQLKGAKNQSNYGKPVPLVLGKHLFTPMYIGNPYTTIGGVDGEDQYFHCLYLLGYSRLRVTDLQLGPTSGLASNKNSNGDAIIDDGFLTFDGDPFFGNNTNPHDPKNPRIELIQSNRESDLYPQAVVEEPLSFELSHPQGQDPLTAIRHSAKNPLKVQIEFSLPNGLLRYNDEGGKQSASVSISIRWRRATPNDSHGWNNFAQIGLGQAGITYNAPVTTITRTQAKQMRFIAEKTFTKADIYDSYNVLGN
jgi:hypothetical protein